MKQNAHTEATVGTAAHRHFRALPLGKAWLALASVLLMGLALTACSESDDEEGEFDNWQERNETFFSGIYSTAQEAVSRGDTSWRIIRSYALEDTVATSPTDYIVVHVEQEGTGSGCPLFTDSVLVDYQGRLIPSKSFPNGYIFDQSWYGDTLIEAAASPSHLYVGGVVDGFSTALQHMHIGDRWTVYMPYTLGYGASGNSTANIDGYSVLVFDIRLRAYYRAGSSMP